LFALQAGQALLTGLADDAPRSLTARKALISWFASRAYRAHIAARALLAGQAD
jgi:hypothetical protein